MPAAQVPQWVILVLLELLRTLTAITNLPTIPPLDILRRGVDDDSPAAPLLRYHHATLSFARRLLRPVAAGVSDDCSPLAHEELVLVLIEQRHVVVDAMFQANLVNDDVDECLWMALLELSWVSKECWKD